MAFATQAGTGSRTGLAVPDRRAEQRNRTFKGGLLTFNRGFGALECIVRGRSEHGARLSFGDATAVPPTFTLRIGAEGPRFATVRWRAGTDVGVALE